jgi:uncharacterized protein YciI
MAATESQDWLAARLKIVDEHIARENQHDLEGILRTFGPTARYDDEPWDGTYRGAAALREPECCYRGSHQCRSGIAFSKPS